MGRVEEATVDGVRHATVVDLARACGVTSRTIERWLVDQVIPQPTRTSPRGWKLWTPQQSQQILQIAISRRKPPPKEDEE